MGHLNRICKDAFSMAGAVQETCSSEMLGGPEADFLRERECILEHQIFRFAKMMLRDRCSTSYDLASLFRGLRSTLDISALNFPFLKEVLQNCFLFDVVNLENEEVSQTCFVFDVVKFKN